MDDVPLPPAESGEEWRDVPDYQDLYQVSNHGRVWSVPRWTSNNGGQQRVGGKLLRPKTHRDGHHQVNLYHDRHGRVVGVHQLVMLAFVGPPGGRQVCHGTRRNPNGSVCDWLDNLRYGTGSENSADRVSYGVENKGADHGLAKLTEEDVREIRRLYASEAHLPRHKGWHCKSGRQWTYAALATKFGVSESQIGEVLRGRSYQNVDAQTTVLPLCHAQKQAA